ncbi:hypothetical protein K2173_020342 [Erythroxylum novogranatense]|uniref:Uncharacterized protein n=1 Tax=Erythroxylum novogranatense TaxID=1862640 RepID=A0AAV8UC54_9ROSI|nr:hypothetical protein K2173_020342 [Erythroxylum novogranatense]
MVRVEGKSSSEVTIAWDEIVKEAAEALAGAIRGRKRLVGVRQRPSGRWGSSSPTSSSPPALSSKITNILLQRLKERNNSSGSLPTSVVTINQIGNQELDNDSREGTSDNINGTSDASSMESVSTDKEESVERYMKFDYSCSDDLDFRFLDDLGSSVYSSPFEIAEEIEEPMEPENGGDEPSMFRAAVKRMKYERKFSRSLYASNGIPECLKLKLRSGNEKGRERSEQLLKLQDACNNNEKNAEEASVDAMEKEQEENLQSSVANHHSGPLLIYHHYAFVS